MAFVIVGAANSTTPCTDGFRCDGVNDASTIRAADDSLSDGDTVYFTDGRFICDTATEPNIGANALVHAIGAVGPHGEPATEFYGEPSALRAATMPGHDHDFQRYENIKFTGRFRIYTRSNTHVRNCVSYARDYGGNMQTTHSFTWTLGIDESTALANVRLERCGVVNSHAGGFQVLASSADGITFSHCHAVDCAHNPPRNETNTRIRVGPPEVWDYVNWSPGFSIERAASGLSNCLFDHCVATQNYNSGFHMETSVAVTSCVFRNCIARYNGLRKVSDQRSEQIALLVPPPTPDPGACYWNAGFAVVGENTSLYDCVAIDNHRGYYLFNDANGESPKLYRCREVNNVIGYDADDGAVNPYMYRCVTERAKRTAVEGTNCTNFQVLELRRVPAGEGTVDISGTSTVTYAD